MPYRYVGPEEIRQQAQPSGTVIRTPEDLLPWLGDEGATFVVGLDGFLRLAPRRSEHVACASGEDVLAAGEVWFAAGPEVAQISNQSTGYCPDPDCFPSVAAALSRAGVAAPAGFTHAFVFRLCESCGERNVVKDGWFVCAHCDAELPSRWNF